jgi:polysaccharide chain length determinant protein (PEP-CTERM system associated)
MGISGQSSRPQKTAALNTGQVSIEHYIQILWHRKWVIIGTFLLVTMATVLIVRRLPNLYTSQTLILVDPQKVPESYVKSTVTGDVRGRLGTLSQQILSATRLQKIIDALNLYQEERKKKAREEIVMQMRKDITTTVVSDFGNTTDLQAFRIQYRGRDPRLVAQVTNQLANLFIDENLKAREKQAAGTTEFLDSQLQETRKTLETLESKVTSYKMKHIGEMPESESADLQILGHLQSQLQLEGEALARAEQQKAYLQSMMTQNVPVVDSDPDEVKGLTAESKQGNKPAAPKSTISSDRAKLAELLTRYKETYPDVIRLKKKIEADEAKQALTNPTAATTVATAAASPDGPPVPAPPTPPSTKPAIMPSHFNPVLQAQIETIDAEIAKHKEEQQRLNKSVVTYQAKLEAIPVRQQEITQLVRDYDMAKAHYAQFLDKQMSAETATQLELQQKAQKFVVLDPATVSEIPSWPNRPMFNLGGAAAGLALGFVLALLPEVFGMAIIAPQDITAASGLAVLEVIPVILTQNDQRMRTRRLLIATASAVIVTVIAGAALFLNFRNQI